LFQQVPAEFADQKKLIWTSLSRYQRARLKENASPRSVNIEVSLVRLVMRKLKLWMHLADDCADAQGTAGCWPRSQ
jgi:hypothetical protein